MNDRLDFSIEGVSRSVENMREQNAQNQKNQKAFVEYVESQLAPEWNTAQGRVATAELKKFAETEFQEYIDYLNRRIDAVEYSVIPALNTINNA